MIADLYPRMAVKNETWEVDEILHQRAEALVNEYMDRVGHVDLRRVVFARVEGKKTEWLGRCYKIKPPHGLLPKYAAYLLNKFGVSVPADGELSDYLEVEYIIALNQDNISLIPNNRNEVIDIIILHELMHVDYEMGKLVKHDSEDFKWILKEFGVDWATGDIKKGPLSSDWGNVPKSETTEWVDPETGEVFEGVMPPPLGD